MAEEMKIENTTRRSAIKTAAQVAVTAPAVGLLLSGSAKAAAVRIHYGDDSQGVAITGDDVGGFNDDNHIVGITGDDFYTF